MGKVKAFFNDVVQCPVCGGTFVPSFCLHKMNDPARPTCSEQCDQEFTRLMEEIARVNAALIKSDRDKAA